MEIIKKILASSRFKSFVWRTAMMVLAVILGAMIENINLLTPYVNGVTVTILGLVLGEVSKAINNWLTENPITE